MIVWEMATYEVGVDYVIFFPRFEPKKKQKQKQKQNKKMAS